MWKGIIADVYDGAGQGISRLIGQLMQQKHERDLT
jgi:hypothetical protein